MGDQSLMSMLILFFFLVSLVKYSKTVPHIWIPLLLITQLDSQVYTQKIKKLFFLETALSILTVWLLMTILITIYSNFNHMSTFLTPLILILIFIILLFFNSNNILNFYIFFELSIVPIFLIILIWGYQSERLFASLSLLLYTFLASLPFLFMIIFYNQKSNNIDLELINMNTLTAPQHSAYVSFFLTLAFLVKTPLYLTHMWLPKAHVEAPVFGSMILAAILLKMGTFGLSLFMTFSYTASGFWWLLGLSLWGTLIVTIFSIKIMDMKVLIAYSSVSHMAFLISLILLNQHLSLTSSTFMMITHGFSSSALFFMINILYELSNSRNTMFNKGILYTSTTLYLMWALVLMSNISAPPTINFVAEFFGVLAILISNMTLTTIVVFFMLFTAAYSYFMFSLTAQLKTNNFLTFFVYSKNYLILIGHIAPIFFLTLNMQNFY